MMDDSVLSSQCDDVLSHLVELKINFLALDFDQTILDIHTGGKWRGSAQELAEHVRPMFYHLIKAAHDANVKVAVVTFSSQVEQISHILELYFPEFSTEIIIRGRDKSWSYEGNGMKLGKQPFMASAVEEFETIGNVEISRNSTLLVDDDPQNIKLALKDGVRAILFLPHKSLNFFKDVERIR